MRRVHISNVKRDQGTFQYFPQMVERSVTQSYLILGQTQNLAETFAFLIPLDVHF